MRQAAQEQLEHPTPQGLSIKTVQQIAAEVGIPPKRVERAARQLETRGALPPVARLETGAFWLGSPTVIEAERVVEGEVSGSLHADIVDEVQATLSTEGVVNTSGGSLTWRTEKPVPGQSRAVQVRVTSRAGRTRVHVQERIGLLATALFPPFGGVGIGGLAVALSVGGPELGWLAASLLGGGWVGAMHALARRIYRGVARNKRAELQELSDRVAAIASHSDSG